MDRVIDAGILLATLLIGFFLGRTSLNYMPFGRAAGPQREVRTSLTDPIGKRISLSGVDWGKHGRTLVIALQSGCRYCLESATFYQRLTKMRSRFGATRMVAVLPHSLENSSTFLMTLGLSVDEIHQGTLQEIGVQGTPTLLLVNSSGIVTEAWIGKLQPAAEDAVLARLQVQ
ncbi:MAG TPA: hypothetical protein VNL38_04385 [Candidatus Nitrosotenuis sp.]|nr:hypothetical protein [Candidatus Nitrosotenuis sp.]